MHEKHFLSNIFTRQRFSADELDGGGPFVAVCAFQRQISRQALPEGVEHSGHPASEHHRRDRRPFSAFTRPALCEEQPNIAIAEFPYIYLPGIVVPLVLVSHLLSLKALRHGPASWNRYTKRSNVPL